MFNLKLSDIFLLCDFTVFDMKNVKSAGEQNFRDKMIYNLVYNAALSVLLQFGFHSIAIRPFVSKWQLVDLISHFLKIQVTFLQVNVVEDQTL